MVEQTLTSTAINPYAAPNANLVDAPMSEAERLRRQHLNHEVSIKALGTLCCLAAAGISIVALIMANAVLSASTERLAALVGQLVIVAGATLALGVLGFGLRTLRPWARVPTIVLSAIGLLGFPLGTLLNAYVLYLLICRKGRFVLSARYAEVRRLTRHVKYRSAFAWIALVLLVVLIAAAIGPLNPQF